MTLAPKVISELLHRFNSDICHVCAHAPTCIQMQRERLLHRHIVDIVVFRRIQKLKTVRWHIQCSVVYIQCPILD